MRVAVIGGTGVFGSRLALMLARDGHAVIACARSPGREAVPGVSWLALDWRGNLAPLWAAQPEAVVDAAGPFHGYGDDPYRLARACIARGVHYLDLADNVGFCAGIGALDPAARDAGVMVLSGVSSVPCLSSAAAVALGAGMDAVDTVSTAILPGNRAPRGRAVVESILHQAGRPFGVTVDGRPEVRRSWSDPAAFVLAPGMVRRGYVIEVPDQRLLPPALGARTVEFRAGLELGVMNRGLAALSALRARFGFGMPGWLVGAVLAGAKALAPFGSDAGGMVVSVTGRVGGTWVRRDWVLVVRNGEGPFVPGVAARAILRAPGAVPAGARPAVGVVRLALAEAAMADLAACVTRREVPVVPMMRRVLGAGFDALPPQVQASHDHAGPRRWSGRASVERGRGLVAGLIARVFRFPEAAADVAVTVAKTPVEGGETWERRFGPAVFRSHLRDGPRGLSERFGPLTFDLALHTGGGALHWPVARGRCLGLPLPRILLPESVATEHAGDGRFRFDVALHAPLGLGLIVRYRGWLVPDGGTVAIAAARPDGGARGMP